MRPISDIAQIRPRGPQVVYEEIISPSGTIHYIDKRNFEESGQDATAKLEALAAADRRALVAGRTRTLCGMHLLAEYGNPDGPNKGKRCDSCGKAAR